MARRITSALLALVALAAWQPARAGVYTDDLTKCLVKSATASDQTQFILWIFGGMSAHPAISKYSAVQASQRDAFSKQVAGLMTRLLAKDCRTETVAALKFEGNSALENSFKVLGEIAMRGITSAPEVDTAMTSFTAYLDKQEFEALFAEAKPKP